MSDLFVDRNTLRNEADTETLVVDRLLTRLRYPDESVRRKAALKEIALGRGSKKEKFRPDYVLLDSHQRPVAVIEAKSPNESPRAYHYQVSGYALKLNQQHEVDNPVRYICVTNGLQLILWEWDNETPLLEIDSKDFVENNPVFVDLQSYLAYDSIQMEQAAEGVFKFKRPNLNELIHTFNECHQLIWKKEKHGPTDAFYEFAKLMFIKLRADRRIAAFIAEDTPLTESSFTFSVDWIKEQVERQVSDNPVKDVLFKGIYDELEQLIASGEKKRIFPKGEDLNLRSGTIERVVSKLQHFNLHGIDEDLNGRMFETFLNATVRGKELGQFFTPRSVVKYMVRTAKMHILDNNLPLVLDGCCGSGGFLIEAMAHLTHAIDMRSSLTNKEKKNLKETLHKKHLYGVDASEKIARISRLNMYLHGDGGSTIYAADMLDKEVTPPNGLSRSLIDEVKELKQRLIDEGLRFDMILTNPPFSMTYKSSDPDENRVLKQYQIATNLKGKMSKKEKSNVLFIERYYDLMSPNGEMLIVIDNTVLNGEKSQGYRNYLMEKFIIRQVISLPFNTFFCAQANVQTSILHLKKRNKEEVQGDIFMGILNNIGHDDHQQHTPARDNIPILQQAYSKWREEGIIPDISQPNENTQENLSCPFQVFIVSPEDINKKRLDAFYYAPELMEVRKTLQQKKASGHLILHRGRDFNTVRRLSDNDAKLLEGKLFRYFEIGDVTRSGDIVRFSEDYFENLPSRARLQVKEGDVLFARNNSSRGTSVIVPPDFDGQLVTTGFIAVRPQNSAEAKKLWAAFMSDAFRKQIYYLAITAVQPEIRDNIFQNEIIIPAPMKPYYIQELHKCAQAVHDSQVATRHRLEALQQYSRKLYDNK